MVTIACLSHSCHRKGIAQFIVCVYGYAYVGDQEGFMHVSSTQIPNLWSKLFRRYIGVTMLLSCTGGRLKDVSNCLLQ